MFGQNTPPTDHPLLHAASFFFPYPAALGGLVPQKQETSSSFSCTCPFILSFGIFSLSPHLLYLCCCCENEMGQPCLYTILFSSAMYFSILANSISFFLFVIFPPPPPKGWFLLVMWSSGVMQINQNQDCFKSCFPPVPFFPFFQSSLAWSPTLHGSPPFL